MKQFILNFIVFTVVLAGIALGISKIFTDTPVLVGSFWLIFTFFAVITFVASILALMGMKRKPDSGIMALMGAVGVKMFFSMVFVLIYSQKGAEKGMLFVANFFSVYLLFSFFEIYSLLRNLRHQNK
ncbi:MAG: hypothetical protein REI78_08180 [Pedobacter sp.]|nr:hypothetical protein [Pedobacter sp.]MDQ8052990.1 hypothetical protein [Pedobacter sp.]